MSKIEILARGAYVSRGMLLVCHTRGATNTYLPGGHVEFGEGAEKAVCRELVEEMGKKSVVRRFLGCVEHAFRQKGKKHVEINLVFELKVSGVRAGKPVLSREKHLDFKWIPLADLESSDLEPACLRPHLAEWLKGGKGPWASSVPKGT